jgi:hypothetical protein
MLSEDRIRNFLAVNENLLRDKGLTELNLSPFCYFFRV